MSATYAHLTPTERDLLLRCEEVARDVLEPLAAAGEPGRVNRALVAAIAAEGLFRRVLAGDGVCARDLCIIREGLARHSLESETAFAVQCLGAHPIVAAAQRPVVQEWLPRIVAGEAVTAFALTEPSAGSDVAAISLRAERDRDGYRLSGEKCFISNAPEADVYAVFARTTRDAGARGLTCFVVPGDSRGLTGEATSMASDHPIGSLIFDGVWVPQESVVGDVDGGFGLAMRTLDLFRPSVGAFGVGMAQSALDAAVRHAATRMAFGSPLSRLQGVTHQLADVATRIQAARLLVYAAASAYEAQEDGHSRAAAMAKLFATETAGMAVDVAVQVHGARALVRGHPLERLSRDVRTTRIYEGASEVQREIIARSLFRD